MAEGNGEVSLDKVTGQDPLNCSEDFNKLIEYGLDTKVAIKLDEIYKTGKLAHIELDARALDALKEFPIEGALNVLEQFVDSNLEHVSNKSAFLCGVMKTYRQKTRASQQGSQPPAPAPTVKGPNEDNIKAILARTGYTLDVTTGQRKYGGPPPGWEGSTPGIGCEVFCGKIPKDIYEDDLIPLFEGCGTIWDLRLMMDPMTGTNRGYAFVTFTTREAAACAVKELDNHEIKPGKVMKINISVPNLRLFVGNIPKSKGKEEILDEFGKLTAGLMEVIIYSSPDDKKKNRGFCFLEYESHKAASLAKRRLGTGRIKVWGCDIIVDWADPQEEPDEQTMSQVKVLYVRNLTQDISEEALKDMFESYGKVERVKKIKDYAFIHFADRDNAVKAMSNLDGKEMDGSQIEVSLAKPPSDKKKKEEILRARERRLLQMMHGRGGGCSPQQIVMYGRNVRPSGQFRDRDIDYDYEYYGYGDYRGGYNEPYFRYDELYYDYATPTQASAARQGRNRAQPDGHLRGAGRATGAAGGGGMRATSLGSGSTRADRGPPTSTVHQHNHRGNPRVKGNLPGKRKFEGGHQNQGGDMKRRMGGVGGRWGSRASHQPPAQQSGTNGADHPPWHMDTYQTWS